MTENSHDVITLERSEATYCKVHLYGATLISWKCKGVEHIFLSSKSKLDGTKPIRGGIPIVFPTFGPWANGPQHGFARICRWTCESLPQKDEADNIKAKFILEDNEETRKMWNYRFKLSMTIYLMTDSIESYFEVLNEDTVPFNFTCLLHTYFRVPDIRSVKLEGLGGSICNDKINKKEDIQIKKDLIEFDGIIDSVFSHTLSKHVIVNDVFHSNIAIEKFNFPDTVVWNPWREKGLGMPDLMDEWQYMVCVEAGRVKDPVQLKPAELFTASQILTIE